MSDIAQPSFNLLTNPWIPVVGLSGGTAEVSLLTLFRDAHRIRRVIGDIPQLELPLIRLCVAIMYRAFAGGFERELRRSEMRKAWEALWLKGSFPMEALEDYLDEYKEGFDLFGARPFFQVPGLAYSSKDKEFDPIRELIADVPKDAKYLFSMRARNAPGDISYAEAARWLLFFNSYDFAGIKTPVVGNSSARNGKVYPPKGYPGTGWLGSIGGVFLEGNNLFETLMMNFVMYDTAFPDRVLFENEHDSAPWERSTPLADCEIKIPQGPAQMLTWQSRRARLVASEVPGQVKGVIGCYGDVLHPTEAPGWETMTSWRPSAQQQKALGTSTVPLMPKTHVCGRALWRGLSALLSKGESADGDYRPGVIRWLEELRYEEIEGVPDVVTIHAQGVEYGAQSSVIANALDDRIDLGSAMMRSDSEATTQTIALVAQTEQAVSRLATFVREVGRIKGDARGDRDSQTGRMSDDVRDRAYAELDELFRSKIAGFSTDEPVVEYCNAWYDETHRVLLRLARSYLADAGPQPFTQRKVYTNATYSAAEAFSRLSFSLNELLGSIEAPRKREGVSDDA